MSKAPMCKLCRTQHWLSEPHTYGSLTQPIVSRETMVAKRQTILFDWAARERELGLPEVKT